MNPLIGIAAALFPEIIKLIAGDKGGSIGSLVVKAVTDVTGATTPEAAKAKIDANPEIAADLQVKLAQIAIDARRQEAEAQIERDKLRVQAERERREADLADVRQSAEETSSARATLRELAKMSPAIGWTPSLISFIVVIGFLVVIGLLMRGYVAATGSPEVTQVLNICIGALAAGFATVLNFWLGSSVGSRNKDSALSFNATVAQARELREEISHEAQKKSPIVRSL